MIRSDSIELVAAALVKAQNEMGTAKKDSNNPFFKSKYADLNAIREAIMPALFANGLSILQPMTVDNGKNYIETVIIHTSGQYIGGITEVVHTKKDNAQDFGAGTTYARRFGLQSMLCVGAEDDDGNTVTGKTTSAPPRNNAPTEKALSEPAGDKKPADDKKPGGRFQPPKKTETKVDQHIANGNVDDSDGWS